jgi:hypothetical protein
MRPLVSKTGSRGNRRIYAHPLTWLIVTICAFVAPGCEEETRNLGKRPETRALDQTGVSAGLDESPRPQAPARPPAKPSGPIIGQRTTDIREASKELKQGGAQVASSRIVARDPITIQGNAYVSIVGQAAIGNMKHAVDLFHAENDRYPKDYDEFMSAIVKPHGIALPQLPPYRKYAYDDNEHKLIIVEYPDLKN